MATKKRAREMMLSFGADDTMKVVRHKMGMALAIIEKGGMVVRSANLVMYDLKAPVAPTPRPSRAKKQRSVVATIGELMAEGQRVTGSESI